MQDIYNGKNLLFPSEYDSTATYPPISFMKYVILVWYGCIQQGCRSDNNSVTAKDDVDVDGLRKVQVPSGLNVEIIDFDEE